MANRNRYFPNTLEMANLSLKRTKRWDSGLLWGTFEFIMFIGILESLIVFVRNLKWLTIELDGLNSG